MPDLPPAIELRKAGLQPSEIAARLDMTEEQVNEEVRTLLRAKADALPDDEVMLELERLDTLTKAQWVGAIKGDKGSIRSVMDLQQRRLEVLANAKKKPRLAPGRALNNAVAELYRKTKERQDENGDEQG